MLSSSPSSKSNAFSSTAAAFPWCMTARISPTTGQVIVKRIDNENASSSSSGSGSTMSTTPTLDLSCSSDWMEWIEQQEGLSDQFGGAGAYDVFRCDLHDGVWKVWGLAFHLQRLEQSYQSLMRTEQKFQLNGFDTKSNTAIALEQSNEIVSVLLKAAKESDELQMETPSIEDNGGDVWIQLVRMTVLWSPSVHGIHVRGHACCSTEPTRMHRTVEPITVSLAMASTNRESISSSSSSLLLPHRYDSNPLAKIASWTRQRKKLERPETFKPPGVSEVLMVHKRENGKMEILEGLSSNFFVMCKDGTVKTAQEGVLHGYARHLVLECLGSCGLQLDTNPIYLDEHDQWEEAFITSSSRLIYPIDKILVPASHQMQQQALEQLWVAPTKKYNKWKELLDEILRRAGY